MHYFPKYVTICKGRSFRKEYLVVIVLDGALPQFAARVEGIKLESKGPPLGVFVVSLEDVAARCILPLVNWLLDGVGVEQCQECAFASSDVSFD